MFENLTVSKSFAYLKYAKSNVAVLTHKNVKIKTNNIDILPQLK